MTTPAITPITSAPSAPPRVPLNGECVAALSAAEELSKIGTKKREIRQRLAQLIIWLREALQEYSADRDIIINTWAARDDAGEIKTATSEDGKVTRIVMRNEIEANLAENELRMKPAKSPNHRPVPPPFTWDELDEHFTTLKDRKEVPAVSAELAARLGPFVNL